MKNRIILPLCGLLLTFALGQSAYAQTPDGETPANEGVCDVVQGGTPGLYGLCVAFCEAQDHASLDEPITEEELDALMDAKPAGRILANYNKKKKEGDPDMPCIKVEEPCPCWTADELASIDFLMFNGEVADRKYCDDRFVDVGSYQYELINVFELENTPYRFTQAVTYDDNWRGRDYAYCRFTNRANNADGSISSRLLFRQNGEITQEQYESCQSSLRSHIDTIRSNCNEGNQAP